MRNIFGILISFAFIGLVMASAKLFEKSGKEASRKYIHIVLSNWWIIAMIFFDNVWFAAFLPALFVIINTISYKTNLISVMEREDGDENKESLGTVFYALSLLILSIVTFGPLKNPLVGLCGIAVMGYGDGMAAIVGQSFKIGEYKIGNNKKTLSGSFAMLLITFIIISGFLAYTQVQDWFVKAIIISVIVALIEAISIKGTDNLTVPLITAGIIFLVI